MGLVTTFWPLTTTGEAEIEFQIAVGGRLVVNASPKPVTFVGHVKSMFAPANEMDNGGGVLADVSERLKTVPLLVLPGPPADVVP